MQVFTFKKPVVTITSLSELYVRIRTLIPLVKTKKVISMNYVSSTSSWKPWRWVRLDLMLSMRNIYISSKLNLLTKFTSSSRSPKFKDILPWDMSQMIRRTVPVGTRIVISYAMERASVVNLMKSQWKLIQQHDQNFAMEESHSRTNTSVRRNK